MSCGSVGPRLESSRRTENRRGRARTVVDGRNVVESAVMNVTESAHE